MIVSDFTTVTIVSYTIEYRKLIPQMRMNISMLGNLEHLREVETQSSWKQLRYGIGHIIVFGTVNKRFRRYSADVKVDDGDPNVPDWKNRATSDV